MFYKYNLLKKHTYLRWKDWSWNSIDSCQAPSFFGSVMVCGKVVTHNLLVTSCRGVLSLVDHHSLTWLGVHPRLPFPQSFTYRLRTQHIQIFTVDMLSMVRKQPSYYPPLFTLSRPMMARFVRWWNLGMKVLTIWLYLLFHLSLTILFKTHGYASIGPVKRALEEVEQAIHNTPGVEIRRTPMEAYTRTAKTWGNELWGLGLVYTLEPVSQCHHIGTKHVWGWSNPQSLHAKQTYHEKKI